QLVVGALLLLFGMRWLRKAVLRAAGVLSLHDEEAIYQRKTQALRGQRGARPGLDKLAFAVTFKSTMLEGLEVVFIVLAIGAGRVELLWPASLGALAALLLVAVLGAVVHRPLARVPENTLKFVVGVLLCAFGTYWAGEGMGYAWPGGDWAIPGVAGAFLAMAALCVPWCRRLASIGAQESARWTACAPCWPNSGACSSTTAATRSPSWAGCCWHGWFCRCCSWAAAGMRWSSPLVCWRSWSRACCAAHGISRRPRTPRPRRDSSSPRSACPTAPNRCGCGGWFRRRPRCGRPSGTSRW